MASLPISNSCGNFFVTSTGSASASMSLTSVSPITGRRVPPSLHTRSDGQTNDTHRTLRHIRLYIYFLAMSDLTAPVSSGAWTCSPEISSWAYRLYKMVTALLLVAPWSLTLSGLIQRNICVMDLIAACADWLSAVHDIPSDLCWRSGWGSGSRSALLSYHG